MVVHGTDPYNAEPAPHALAGRHLTPVDTFYTRNHGRIPALDPTTWRLRVEGLVATPLELGLGQLQEDFEQRTVTATLQCAGNRRSDLNQVRHIPGEDPWGSGATSTATWTGVRLADVLRTAGTHKDARHVCFSAPDGTKSTYATQTYGSSIEIRKALSDEVLLAWQMNGRALPAVHGAPVRVVVPGYIGARSVKWLDRVTASLHPSKNYFQETAYRLLPAHGTPGPGIGISLGPVALNSAILAPADGTTIPVGPTDVHGYAYASDRGIARVDVSLDDGATWIEAALDDQAGPWTWCLWRTTLPLPEGIARISARAWDTAGATQPRSAWEVWNPKGYLNTSWARVTVTVLPAQERSEPTPPGQVHQP
jgi:sulfite oxidase